MINEKIEKGSIVTLAPCWYGGKVATDYPECYEIVERLVKPERLAYNETKNAWNKSVKERWWQFGAWRKGLEEAIAPLERVLVVAQVSKTVAFTFVPVNQAISMMCIAIASDSNIDFSVLQSTIHKEWVHKYASALKSDIRYTPSDVFQTYPFPEGVSEEIRQRLEELGAAYHAHRSAFMLRYGLGLTKTYNLFHTGKIWAIPPVQTQLIAYLSPTTTNKSLGYTNT